MCSVGVQPPMEMGEGKCIAFYKNYYSQTLIKSQPRIQQGVLSLAPKEARIYSLFN